MSLPICPVDCTAALPVFDFSLCAPITNQAQIYKIYITTVGNPLIDWTNELEWDSRLDNDAAGAANIRTLLVVGDRPIPTTTDKEISGGRIISGLKQFVINFDIDETNQINYDAMRLLECNGNILFWYETRDGLLYGGNSGIEGKLTLNEVVSRVYDDLILLSGTITWKSKFSPERIVSPITDATGDQFN